MSKTVMFVRKTVSYAHYEMTKEDFIKDHCSGLSSPVAEARWKTLCDLSKKENDDMVWLDEEENEDDDLDYDAVEEFLEEDQWYDDEVYSHCEKFSEFSSAEETKPYADWAFYQTSGGGAVCGYLSNSESKEVVFANKNGFANSWKFTPMKGKVLTFYPADEMKGIVAKIIVA